MRAEITTRTRTERLTFWVTHGLLIVGMIMAVIGTVWAVLPPTLAVVILAYFMFFTKAEQMTPKG